MTTQAHIIGRLTEQSRLQDIFQEIQQGKGRIILFAGEAGIGKTALAEECLAQSGLNVFIGRAMENATPPYGPIISALRDCHRQKIGEKIDLGNFRQYLAFLLPELGPAPETVDNEMLVEALSAALAGIANIGPAAIFLDDIQWADNATLEILPVLADRLRNHPLLILATYRSDEIPRGHRIRWLRNELRRRRQLQEISVEALSRHDAAVLIERVLGASPVSDLTELIFQRTMGVPLFVEELSAALVNQGCVRKTTRKNNAWKRWNAWRIVRN